MRSINSCVSKRTGAKKKYYDLKDAEGNCKRLERELCHPMHVYKCQECGAYHIGRLKHNKRRFKKQIHRILTQNQVLKCGEMNKMFLNEVETELYELFKKESRLMNFERRFK